MAKDLAIVLNNGSVNSAVATGLAAQRFRTILLYAELGEQDDARARAAFDMQVAHYKPYREHTLSMPFLSLIQPTRDQTSAASDPRHPTPIAPQMIDLLPLIATSLRFAAHYQAAAVYLGLRVGPSADELAQATEYAQLWNELVQLPCNQPELNVEMPLLELEPWQVVDVGFQASVPFDRTWSCDEGGSEPCWACKGCRAREAAFQQAGKPDPLRVVRKI